VGPQGVLVLSSQVETTLVDALVSIGFSPLVRGSIQSALDRIRREKFAAIVVDQKRVKVDVLEFILNVRDIDAEIPVLVVGPSQGEPSYKTLQRLDNTVILQEFQSAESLAKGLQSASRAYRARDA
jgi:DNA-binding NtrC family response regulator